MIICMGSGIPGRERRMEHSLVAKFGRGAALDVEDEALLLEGFDRIAVRPGRCDLLRGEEAHGRVHVVLEGFACRYATLPDGRRQILAYLVAGDVFDLRHSLLGRVDHAIATLSPCRIAAIAPSTLDAWSLEAPRLRLAFARAALVEQAVLRQWFVNLGGRRVDQRIAHLFVELLHRLEAVDLATSQGYALPITQDDLSATIGGSMVHVCRVLSELREAGLVEFRHGRVRIGDLDRLTALAGFDPGYLHLGAGRSVAAQAARPEREGGVDHRGGSRPHERRPDAVT